jgi:hypothetical protein
MEGEDYDDYLFQVNLDIPLHKSLYHLQYPWVGVLHQMNAKTVLQNN